MIRDVDSKERMRVLSGDTEESSSLIRSGNPLPRGRPQRASCAPATSPDSGVPPAVESPAQLRLGCVCRPQPASPQAKGFKILRIFSLSQWNLVLPKY